MSTLKLPESGLLLEGLRRIYQKAEQDILDAVFYKRGRGLVDYAETAALERVQRILTGLQDDCWRYVPRLVESYFYEEHPEAARLQESAAKHAAGYWNAAVLTSEQTAVVSTLTANLMGELIQAAEVAGRSARAAIGRLNEDLYRRAGISAVAAMEAGGMGTRGGTNRMMAALRAQGVAAFTDRAGRNWRLYDYCSMVTRTASRQAQVLSVLERDPAQDLFQISRNGTACPICAPLEGRVYSKSGENPAYPPLALAFGKVDKAGPDTLQNSFLNIHPNCLHVLRAYSTAGMTEEEIERDRRFSSFATNPPEMDPRSKAQIDAYRSQQAGRRRFLSMLHEYGRYRAVLGDRVPRTVQTFIKHKLADDEKYRAWKALFNRLG